MVCGNDYWWELNGDEWKLTLVRGCVITKQAETSASSNDIMQKLKTVKGSVIIPGGNNF